MYLLKWLNLDALKYKATLTPPSTPTFGTSSFFLFNNLINNKLITLDYDSDHKAILLEIELEEPPPLTIFSNTKLYKATN